MRRSVGRVSALVLVAACTAAPIALPRDDGPPTCSPPTLSIDRSTVRPEAVVGRFWLSHTDSDELAWVDPVNLRPTPGEQANLHVQNEMWATPPSGASPLLSSNSGQSRLWGSA